MEDWNYLVFQAFDYPILIRYKCADRHVSAEEIEEAICNYLDEDSDAEYEQVAKDVMASFENVTFEFLPCREINY